MQTLYRGWIPTVTGRLSFSHFGNCGLPNTRDVNRADPRKRYLLVYQTRNTSDILLPFRRHLGELLFRLRGELQFVCIAETKDITLDQQALLVGNIYIFDKRSIWPKHVRNQIIDARDHLQSYNYTADSSSIESHFAQYSDDLKRTCSAHCFFQARFSLHRNGVVEFSVDTQMEVSPEAPRLPGSYAHRKHVEHILAAQLFFFLKDIGHRHQHHDARTDTIVDLYNVSDEGNDLSWRLGTLYSIYRRIISNKRARSVNAYFSSLGLLAYAKAFKHVCKEQLPQWLHHRLPTFYDDALEESVRASELDMEFRSNKNQEKNERHRNVILATFGFLFSMLGLLTLTNTRISAVPDPYLIKIAEFLVSYPLIVSAIILVLIFASYMRPEDQSSSRSIFYFFQPFNQFFTSAFFVLLGASIITAQVYFIYRFLILG